MKAAIASLALLAAIAATICDANHAYTGALHYPEPGRIGIQAWWVFPGFVLAFASMALIYLWFARALSGSMATEKSTSKGSYREMFEAISAFMMVYLASGVGHAFPILLSAIFFGLFFLRWAFTYERTWLLFVAIMLAVGGMGVEGLLSAFDLVAYDHQDIFYVPWWLGGVYMHGAFALREGMRGLVYQAPAPLE